MGVSGRRLEADTHTAVGALSSSVLHWVEHAAAAHMQVPLSWAALNSCEVCLLSTHSHCFVFTCVRYVNAVAVPLQGPVPLIPDAASKHVDFVDFPTIHPDYKGKPYRSADSGCGCWRGSIVAIACSLCFGPNRQTCHQLTQYPCMSTQQTFVRLTTACINESLPPSAVLLLHIHHRYVYLACAVRPSNIGNALAKLDLCTGEVKVWHAPGGITGDNKGDSRAGAECG